MIRRNTSSVGRFRLIQVSEVKLKVLGTVKDFP